jgi:hypothetical protein
MNSQVKEATDVEVQDRNNFDVLFRHYFEFVPEGTTVNQTLYVGMFYWCSEAQARRVERTHNDSSPRQRVVIFFASSVAVFSREMYLRHGPSAVLPGLGFCWLLAVSRPQELLKRKCFSDVEDITSSVEK